MQDIRKVKLMTWDETGTSIGNIKQLTAYLITRLSQTTSPLDGHDAGGRGSTNSGGSV